MVKQTIISHTSYKFVHPSVIHTTCQFQFAILLSHLSTSLTSSSAFYNQPLQSVNLPITSNFGRTLASSLHPSLALLHAVHFNMCFTSLSDSPLNACMSNPCYPKASNPIFRSFTHCTLPPNFIASLIYATVYMPQGSST